jgi:hypothetical protein
LFTVEQGCGISQVLADFSDILSNLATENASELFGYSGPISQRVF